MTNAIQVGDKVRLNAAGIAAAYRNAQAARSDIVKENAVPMIVMRRSYSRRDGCTFVDLKDPTLLASNQPHWSFRLSHLTKAEA